MATVSRTISEERFLCSICLEVFSAPVTTPCGHSFCSTCINLHWDNSDGINCPVCKVDFTSRPQMKVNTVLAEMIFEFNCDPQVVDTEVELMSSEPKSAPKGDVVCDLCPEPRLGAMMSCLLCLASYCQDHLQSHLTNPRLTRHHKLIKALPNLEEHICPEHHRPLEFFCRENSHLICLECTSAEHKDHKAVPLKEEAGVQMATLKDQIKQRLFKIDEIRSSVELSQKNADTEIQKGVRVFNIIMQSVQESVDSFKQGIVEKHEKTEEEAAEMIQQIQTEISALEQREAEMEQLWSTGDHQQFVRTFTSYKPAPQLNDWTEKTVRAPSYEARLTKALIELERRLHEEMKLIFGNKFEEVQDFLEAVTLDPDTAHSDQVIS